MEIRFLPDLVAQYRHGLAPGPLIARCRLQFRERGLPASRTAQPLADHLNDRSSTPLSQVRGGARHGRGQNTDRHSCQVFHGSPVSRVHLGTMVFPEHRRSTRFRKESENSGAVGFQPPKAVARRSRASPAKVTMPCGTNCLAVRAGTPQADVDAWLASGFQCTSRCRGQCRFRARRALTGRQDCSLTSS